MSTGAISRFRPKPSRSLPSKTNKSKRPKNTKQETFKDSKAKSKTFHHVDLAEDEGQDKHGSSDKAKDGKTASKSNTASAHKSSGKSSNDRSHNDVTAVPDPIPDAGTFSKSAPLPTYSSSFSLIAPPVTTPAPEAIAATPSRLLPHVLTATSYSSLLVSTSAAASRASQSTSHQDQSGHIRTIMLVLLGIGCAFASVGICICVKVCHRPRKRNLPTPSLPILQDAYRDHSPEEESPIFGGKERFSENLEKDWMWTQYPQTNFTKPEQENGTFEAVSIEKHEELEQAQPTERRKSRMSLLYSFPNPPAGPMSLPSEHSSQNALTRAVSRLSMISYISPRTSINVLDPQNIGLAFDNGNIPLTADGLSVRVKEKVATRRASRDSQSVRRSLRAANKENTGQSCMSLYGGADVTSPAPVALMPSQPVVSMPSPALAHGRERIKAPYSGTSLRASLSASTTASNANPFEDVQNVPVPPLPLVVKTETRRTRDTKAITAVLGWTSPPSPEMTIYPDDSLSVVGESMRRHSRRPAPPRKDTMDRVATPQMEASASLGNLMLNGFGTPVQSPSMSFGVLETSNSRVGADNERRVATAGSTSDEGQRKKRTEDKPPRVPSPPPIPSLAQMALEATNPDDFANYSSPTYSIYGYYTEEERKSRFGDFRVSTFR